MNPKLILVCGVQRSGTTILRKILDSHPEMRVLPETKIFDFTRGYREYFRGAFEQVRKPRAAAYRHDVNVFLLRLALQVLGHARLSSTEVRSALKSTFPGRRLVGDKYPRYWKQIPKFISWPDTHIIYIYRDGRDVVASTLRKVQGPWKSKPWMRDRDTLEKIAADWVNSLNLMQKYEDGLITIRYEDMVQDPRRVMNSVAVRLDAKPEGFDLGRIRTTSLGKYRTDLSAAQIDSILAIAQPTLSQFRYV